MRKLHVLFAALMLAVLPFTAFANEGGGEKEGEAPAGPQFVQVGPVTVPVLRNGRIFQYVSVTVKLETKDAEDAKKITDRMPSLNDAYLSSLYGAFYNSRDMVGPLIDLEKLRSRLASANAKVLPPDIVQSILIQQVNQNTR